MKKRHWVCGAALVAGWSLAYAAAGPDAAPGTLTIDGVGTGAFRLMHVEAKPQPDRTCAVVKDSSGDIQKLMKWIAGNHSSGALASRPEATLEFSGQAPTKKVRLSRITIDGFTQVNSPDGSWHLVAVRIHCEALAPQP